MLAEEAEALEEEVEEEIIPPVDLWIDKISENGLVHFEFNQKLKIPQFIEDAISDSINTTKRDLQTFADINVTRDIIDFEFIQNSETDDQSLNYSLELKNWTADFFEVQLTFNEPLLVSSG